MSEKSTGVATNVTADETTLSKSAVQVFSIKDGGVDSDAIDPAIQIIAAGGISTQTADFDTSSATYVDVTNPATLTLSGLDASKTYTVIAWASGNYAHLTSAGNGEIRLEIDGTAQSGSRAYEAVTGNVAAMSCNGLKTGITGKTSIAIKLQLKRVDSDSVRLDFDTGAIASNIVAIAIQTA